MLLVPLLGRPRCGVRSLTDSEVDTELYALSCLTLSNHLGRQPLALKLCIQRDQQVRTGLMGGHKGVAFTLSWRLVLTDDEQNLVDRYKLHDYPLTWQSARGERVPSETLTTLTRGGSQTLGDVATLVANEEVIKSACDQLPPLFEIASTFGGEEVIEYPRHASATG
jgi:hypothetical protein